MAMAAAAVVVVVVAAAAGTSSCVPSPPCLLASRLPTLVARSETRTHLLLSKAPLLRLLLLLLLLRLWLWAEGKDRLLALLRRE